MWTAIKPQFTSQAFQTWSWFVKVWGGRIFVNICSYRHWHRLAAIPYVCMGLSLMVFTDSSWAQQQHAYRYWFPVSFFPAACCYWKTLDINRCSWTTIGIFKVWPVTKRWLWGGMVLCWVLWLVTRVWTFSGDERNIIVQLTSCGLRRIESCMFTKLNVTATCDDNWFVILFVYSECPVTLTKWTLWRLAVISGRFLVDVLIRTVLPPCWSCGIASCMSLWFLQTCTKNALHRMQTLMLVCASYSRCPTSIDSYCAI